MSLGVAKTLTGPISTLADDLYAKHGVPRSGLMSNLS